MITPEDKIAIYNSKIRRVATFQEMMESLNLGSEAAVGDNTAYRFSMTYFTNN